jgi:hypothetical protein
MKKIIVTIAALLMMLLPVLLLAQDESAATQECKKMIVIKNGDSTKILNGLNNLEDCASTTDCKKILIAKNMTDTSDLEDLKQLKLEISDITNSEAADAADAPFFGIYPAELDFPKAQALNYPYSYGVLITGVVPNSPAYQYRLVEDDVIMEIGGKKAMNLKEFDKLKSAYRAGDAVVLTIFRAGEEKRIDFVFGTREVKEISIPGKPGEKIMKKKLSPGYGGGTWIPMWVQVEMEDVNTLITSLGFDEKLSEDGLLTQGLGGKGNVGKGWFIGGQLGWYNNAKKTDDTANPGYTNYMSYDMAMGGVTLDKRIPITKNIITSMGVMLGGASHSVELMHTNGDYNWPEAGNTTTDIMDGNTYAKMSRGYLLVQPRAEVMVRILSWLGIRGEVGYMYGYAPRNGWTVQHMDTETFELSGAPDTPYQGLTVSVGPWFGF